MRRLPEHTFAAAGLLLFTTGAALRAVPSLPVVLAGTLAIGVGLPWVIVAVFTAVQQRTEPALVGRVAAAAGTAVFGPTAAAAGLGAGLVALADYRLQLVAVGVCGPVAAWLLLLRPGGAACGADASGPGASGADVSGAGASAAADPAAADPAGGGAGRRGRAAGDPSRTG
jgi:cyanate permease